MRPLPAGVSYTAADADLTRSIGIFNAHDDFPVIVAKQRFDGNYDSLPGEASAGPAAAPSRK